MAGPVPRGAPASTQSDSVAISAAVSQRALSKLPQLPELSAFEGGISREVTAGLMRAAFAFASV